MAEVGKRGETTGEILLRYGADRQRESVAASASLFGDDDDVIASSRPAIPSVPSWDNLTRLNKERELVGMYLSAHPLDPYWVEVRCGAEMTTVEKNEIVTPTTGSFTFAGMVVGIEERKSQSGSFSIIKIEDYAGTTDFALFDKQKAEFGHFLVPGSAVMIVGSVKQFTNRSTGVKNLRFSLERVIPLEGLRGRLVEELTVTVKPQYVSTLMEILDKPEFTGTPSSGEPDPVALTIVVYASDIGRKLTFSTAVKVRVCRKLFQALDDLEIDYHIKRASLAG